jgi:nitrogen fixation NifU-like protein
MDDMLSEEMYREHIMELNKNPSNYGVLDKPTHECFLSNVPLCSDEIRVTLEVKDEKIKDINFKANACALCKASASLTTDKIKGMKTKEVLELKYEDVKELLGIPITPSRTKCALLCLQATKKAIDNGDDK